MATTTTTIDRPAETADAPGDQPTARLVYLDPREVLAHPFNLRDNVDVSDILPSIREHGILQPPVISPTDDGGWKIVAGHRRTVAAVEANRNHEPFLVREDLADDIEAVTSMLIENLDRKDLTPLEEARGYQLLFDFGVPKTKIAKRTARRPKRVKDALTVVASEAATEAVEAGLSFDQALTIKEFEDDPEAVEGLYDAAVAGEGEFRHHASYLRENRQRVAERTQAIDAMASTGVTVIDPSDKERWPNATLLYKLLDTDDQEITPEAHANCPGHAAALSRWNNVDWAYYCTDPAAHGHKERPGFTGSSKRTGKMTEEEKAERALVIENNAKWRAAQPVRREYLQRLLSAKKVPKGTLRFVAGEIMARPDMLGDGKDSMLAELMCTNAPQGTWGHAVGKDLVAKAPDARLPLVLLAQVAAMHETHMDAGKGHYTWRGVDTAAARYLTFLEATGYTLSQIEHLVITNAADTNQSTLQPDDHNDQPDDTATNGDTSDSTPADDSRPAEPDGSPALTVVPHPDNGDQTNGTVDVDDHHGVERNDAPPLTVVTNGDEAPEGEMPAGEDTRTEVG